MELWYVYNKIKARVHIFNRIYIKGRLGVSHFEYISQDIDICQKNTVKFAKRPKQRSLPSTSF